MTQHDEDPSLAWQLQEQSLQRALTGLDPPGEARDRLLARALTSESLPPPPADLVASIMRNPRLGRRLVRTCPASLVLTIAAAVFVGLLIAGAEFYAGGIRHMLAALGADPEAPSFVLAAVAIMIFLALRVPGTVLHLRGRRVTTT